MPSAISRLKTICAPSTARLKRCAAAFGLTGRWGFQYANTCSRPRVDAFGGGAHVLDLATGETVAWTYTSGWLADVLDGGDPDA